MADGTQSFEDLIKEKRKGKGPNLTDQDLQNIIANKIETAVGYYTDHYGRYRIKAQNYYEGKPMGTEREGRSKYVSRDCAESVDAIMPGLMRILYGSTTIARFIPRTEKNLQFADDATDYANYIFNVRNRGFEITQDFAKSGLMYRLGIMKIYWDTTTDITQETYENLSEQQVSIFAADPNIELLSIDIYTDPAIETLMENAVKIGAAVSIAGGQEPQNPPPIDPMTLPKRYDITVNRTKERGRVQIDQVPPEEFLYDQWCQSSEDKVFFSHRRKVSKSECREMGIDEDLLQDDLFDDTPDDVLLEEKRVRFENEYLSPNTRELPKDTTTYTTWVSETYISVDWDNDGIAEYRKIVTLGSGTKYVVVENEPIDTHPFVFWTPIRLPYKLVGQSIVDQTMDIQEIKTSMIRNMADNVYLGLNNRPIIGPNVNINDVLNPGPNSPIRAQNPLADIVFPAVPDMTANILNAVNYWDSVREKRTGISDESQGLSQDELNVQSGYAVDLLQQAGAQRMELIARNLAEGIGKAYKRILALVLKHQGESDSFILNGTLQTVKPSDWDREFDVEVQAGLGTNNRDRTLKHLTDLLAIQQQAVQLQQATNPNWIATGPLVTLSNIYNTLQRVVENSNLKNIDQYFTDPTAFVQHQMANPPPPPPPNPEMVKVQADAAYKQQRLAFDQKHVGAKIAVEGQKMQMEQELAAAKLAQKNAEANKKLQLEGLQIVADAKNDIGQLHLDGAKFVHDVIKPFIAPGSPNDGTNT